MARLVRFLGASALIISTVVVAHGSPRPAEAACDSVTAQLIVDGRHADGNYVFGTRSQGEIVTYLRPGASCSSGDRSSVSTMQMLDPGKTWLEVGFRVYEPASSGAPRTFKVFVEHTIGSQPGVINNLSYAPPCTFVDGGNVIFRISSMDSANNPTTLWRPTVSCNNGASWQGVACGGTHAATHCSGVLYKTDSSISGRSIAEEESYSGAQPYDIHRKMQSYYGGAYNWPTQSCRYFTRPAGWQYYPNNDGAGGNPGNAFIIYGGSVSGC